MSRTPGTHHREDILLIGIMSADANDWIGKRLLCRTIIANDDLKSGIRS